MDNREKFVFRVAPFQAGSFYACSDDMKAIPNGRSSWKYVVKCDVRKENDEAPKLSEVDKQKNIHAMKISSV